VFQLVVKGILLPVGPGIIHLTMPGSMILCPIAGQPCLLSPVHPGIMPAVLALATKFM
jgi:hypothetical protein